MLVVDAEEEGNDFESFVTGTLDNVYSGTYGVVSRSAFESANVDLSNFDMVYWQGSNSVRAFYEDEVNKLENYLDGGGNLFITGQDLGSDIFEATGQSQFAQDFYHNYLHANYVSNASTLYLIKGIANDVISNGIQFIANATYARSLDKITPADTMATAFLTYFNGPDVAGVRAIGDGYRVIYMAAGLEQITEEAIRDTLHPVVYTGLRKMLLWVLMTKKTACLFSLCLIRIILIHLIHQQALAFLFRKKLLLR